MPREDFPRAVNWGNPRVSAILEAAAQCFSSRGFTATTLADIGKELGLRKSIVHYYFKSKTSLVEEVQSFAYNRYVEMLGRLLGQQTNGDSVAPSVLEPPASAERPVTSSCPSDLRAGLLALWEELQSEPSTRGLHLELWSEGRRNEEIALRARNLEHQAHRLVREFMVTHVGSRISQESEADDLATITLALLDGLNVRAERQGDDPRMTRVMETFIRLLECGS